MGGYKLSPDAELDLYSIWLFGLEQWGLAAADSYHQALFDRFDSLVGNPLLYPAVDHISQGYRRSVCSSHAIYFRLDAGDVLMVRILGRQDAGEALIDRRHA